MLRFDLMDVGGFLSDDVNHVLNAFLLKYLKRQRMRHFLIDVHGGCTFLTIASWKIVIYNVPATICLPKNRQTQISTCPCLRLIIRGRMI